MSATGRSWGQSDGGVSQYPRSPFVAPTRRRAATISTSHASVESSVPLDNAVIPRVYSCWPWGLLVLRVGESAGIVTRTWRHHRARTESAIRRAAWYHGQCVLSIAVSKVKRRELREQWRPTRITRKQARKMSKDVGPMLAKKIRRPRDLVANDQTLILPRLCHSRRSTCNILVPSWARVRLHPRMGARAFFSAGSR